MYESAVNGNDSTPSSSAYTMSSDGQRVQVILEMVSVDAPIPENLGIIIETTYENLVQVTVPIRNLEAISSNENVLAVMIPPHAQPSNHVSSEGVRVIGSDTLNSYGYTGKGVKVAVIDTGFDIRNHEIAGNIAEYRSFGHPNGIAGSNDQHGTGTAEIIVDIAPDVKLYLYTTGGIGFYDLIDHIIARGDIDIISMSLVYFDAPADGSNRFAQKVNEARDNGILFIISAGNYAESHWQGQFSDTNSNRWHNFQGDDETINVDLHEGEEIIIMLSWDDWPKSYQDYDLALYRLDSDGGWVKLADSTNPQSGYYIPFEEISYTSPYDMTGYIAIYKKSATKPVDFQLFVNNHDIEEQYRVPESSIGIPADATGSFSVGAIHHQTRELEPYSSQGPTLDGRTKPDIVAPTEVLTTAYGYQGYNGTSAAAPHVTGAATLVKEKYPDATADDIQKILESTTPFNRNMSDKNKFGAGLLSLHMLPGTDILALENSNRYCDPCFFPETLRIDPGDSVTWINTDIAPIQITGNYYSSSFESPNMFWLDSYGLRYTGNGISKYHDALHPWATGEIIVGTPPPPTLLYAEITGPNQITANFSEAVNISSSDFTDLQLIPGGNRTVQSISGSGTATITLNFSGQPASLDARATIDVGSGITNNVGTSFVQYNDYSITDGQSPHITHAAFTGPNTVTVSFSEAVNISRSDFTALNIIPGGGRTISSVSGSGTSLISINFSGSPIPADATGNISTGSRITDLAGNNMLPVNRYTVSDAQPPTVSSAGITSHDMVRVTFSESVNAVSNNFTFTVHGESNPRVISSIMGTGTDTILLNISGSIQANKTGNINISGTVSDIAGNNLISVVNYTVNDNQIPVVTSAKVTSPDTVTISFSEPVNAVSSDFTFTVTGESSPRTISRINGTGTDTILLTISGTALDTHTTGSISIANTIADLAGNTLIQINTQTVSDAQPPTVSSAEIISPNTVKILFSEAVNPISNNFTFTANGESNPRTISGIVGTGTDTILVNISGVSLLTNATGNININAVSDITGNSITSIVNYPVMDKQSPVVISAGIISADTILITFSESVNTTLADFANFTLEGENTARIITGITGAGTDSITLIVSGSPMVADAIATIDIRGTVTDLAGNNLEPVINYTVNTKQPPTVISAGITSQDTVTVSFSKPVNATSADFTFVVTDESNPRTISGITGTGSDTILLNVSGDLLSADATGTIDISDMVTDLAGNNLVTVIDYAVSDAQLPTIVSAEITSSDTVTISFSESVNTTSTNYTFTVDGESDPREISSIAGTNTDTILLNVSVDMLPTDATGIIDISGISDIAGNNLAPVFGYMVNDSQPPTLLSVSISSSNADSSTAIPGDIITISFTASEEITNASVTINNTNIIPTSQDGITWTATHTITDADPTRIDVSFAINYTDTSSNLGGMVTTTTDGTAVMVLYVGPITTTVTGTVFSDTNWNGIQDADELGYLGYTMYATDKITGILTSDITASDGTYSFDIIPGNETIVQTHFFPQGHTVYDVRTSWHKSVTIPKGQTISFDVGFHPITPEEQVILNLIMYEDDNFNGIKDAGERTVSNLDDFYIYTYTIGPVAYPVPDENGRVSINDLVPADFAVLVNVESLADEGYVWATTSYELHDNPTEHILVAPLILAPEPGSEYTMMIGLG